MSGDPGCMELCPKWGLISHGVEDSHSDLEDAKIDIVRSCFASHADSIESTATCLYNQLTGGKQCGGSDRCECQTRSLVHCCIQRSWIQKS